MTRTESDDESSGERTGGKSGVTPSSDAPVSVLVEIESAEDAVFFDRWLDEASEYRTADSADDADVCVADVAALRTRGEDITTAKRGQYPAYLPVLILVPQSAGRYDGLAALGPSVTETVDEHIDAPIRQAELARRLDALARIHRLSSNVAVSRERYRGLVEALPEAVLVVADGTVEYANPAAASLFGTDGGHSIEGRSIDRVVSVTEGAEDFEDAVGRALDVDGFVELTLDTGAPTPRVVEMNASHVGTDDGAGQQVLVRDVTHHLLREEQLHLYRRAMDAATVGITIADASLPDNPLVYVNDEFCRLTGRPRADLLGRNARIGQCADTDEATKRRLREAIDAGESVSVEILNERLDGERWWNDLEVTPVRDEAGEVTHFVGFQRDVTERRERKQRLERYETMIQTAVNPIFALDADGRFREVNDAMAEFVGRSREQLRGEDVASVLDQSALETYRAAIADLESSDAIATSTAPVTATNATGVARRFEMSIALDPDEQGSVCLLHDVTEREERRQRLSVLDRVLRHNLRNKLNVVLGHVETLKSDGAAEETVENIERAAQELLGLSETAREFHRTFSRDANPHRSDVMASLAEVVDTVRKRHPEAVITVEGPRSVRAFVAEATFLAIEELIDNGIVHKEGDDPTVEVSVSRGDNYVDVAIRDYGPPVPDHELEVIDRNVERPLSHSSGIALWLSVWAIRRTGGEVEYERLGDGNRMTVFLPAA
jgi:PAS domain S-box-containing protein